jgi:hypothetical protein
MAETTCRQVVQHHRMVKVGTEVQVLIAKARDCTPMTPRTSLLNGPDHSSKHMLLKAARCNQHIMPLRLNVRLVPSIMWDAQSALLRLHSSHSADQC